MTTSQDSPPSIADAFYAGLALFFSMYYVLGLNPEILKDAGMPVSATLLGTFLVIIVGNCVGITRTNTGLMIAPAVGISSFVATFVKTSPSHLDWRYAMLGCFLAGGSVLLTSKCTTWRSMIVDELPEPVRKAAKAGIGALLVSKAFDLLGTQIKNDHLDQKYAVGLMICSVGFLILFVLLQNRIKKFRDKRYYYFLNLLVRANFLIVVAISTWSLYHYQPEYIKHLPDTTDLSLLWRGVLDKPFVPARDNFLLAVLVLPMVIWFIIMSDIPGTPSVVLPRTLREGDGGRAVKMGYVNDGWFALFAPLVGVTPPIYYAENQILTYFEVYDRRVGWVATGLFAIVFILVLGLVVCPNAVHTLGLPPSIERWIPPAAVLPVLLFVGIYIISISFAGMADGDNPPEPNADKTAKQRVFAPEYFIPAAISVILTERLGLEYAFPFSIISYWFVRGDEPTPGASFIWITIGSVVVLTIFAVIYFVPS